MRSAFIQQLTIQARRNPRIFLVVGDLGFSVIEPFAREFPDQFLNAGVAEQNMTGVAAGLASEGFQVFTYSIANFPTLRCLEQIRNDICAHHLPVTVVAVGAGLAYGNLGYSHHAVQDLAILRTLGEITVLSPADPGETRRSVQWLSENPRPAYLRLGKAGEPDLYDAAEFSKVPVCLREAKGSIALVATGSILKVALEAADLAEAQSLSLAVYSMPWIHPLDSSSVLPLARFSRVVAVEEHVAQGGLAACLREHLSPSVLVESASCPPEIMDRVGSQTYLRKLSKLTAEDVVEKILRCFSLEKSL